MRASFQVALVGDVPTGPILRPQATVDAVGGFMREAIDEHLVVLSLDNRRRLLDITTVTTGSARFTVVDPAQIYRVALLVRAAAILLAHNHPSGDPTPSAQDVEVTERVARAGQILGVPLLDHIVIAREGFRSLAEAGAVPISSSDGAALWAV